MKYCPSCRKEYEDRSDFCRIDGTLLRKTTTAKEKSRKEQIPRSKSPEVAEGLFVTEKVAEPTTNASKPLTKEIPLVQDPFAAKTIGTNRNAEANTIEVGRHPSIRGRMVATTAVVAGALLLFIIGVHIFERSEPAKPQELASRQETVPREQSPEAPALPSEADFQSPSPGSGLTPGPSPALGSKSSPAEPQKPSTDANIREARVRETPISRRPAEPGTYETIRTTSAWREPSESAEVIDRLPPGTRLTVTGSHGDWLVVRSRTREMTVYIKRDNATLVSERSPRGDSYQTVEGHWKQLEAEVAESLAKVGLAGVTVSVGDEVVYLDGQVRTDQERFRAQSAARRVPGVDSIRNRIMVVP